MGKQGLNMIKVKANHVAKGVQTEKYDVLLLAILITY